MCSVALGILLQISLAALPHPPEEILLASWNLQWLVLPATAHAARLACDAGRRPALPCDVALQGSRDSADWARLRHYVRALDADLIAFQEVQDAEAALRLFRGYRVCISAGPGLQQTGFAVRAGLPFRFEAPLAALSMAGRNRSGAVLRLLLPGRSIQLLSVHLKSGCAESPLEEGSAACRLLEAQSRVLGSWIAARRAAKEPYILLGDFNRAGPDSSDPFWQRLDAAAGAELVHASAGRSFHNCYVGQPFSRFIDHIVFDPALRAAIRPGSFARRGYSPRDALRYQLSDHCPVIIRVSLNHL